MSNSLKLDVLAIVAHPDDAELTFGGTICKLVDQGKKVGIIDLTRGEMGTRGTPEQRAKEAAASSKIMGIHLRHNLGFRDAFFTDDEAHRMQIIPYIRAYRPEVVLANTIQDRHPDHPKAAQLVKTASFMSGLRMIPTQWEGENQEAWRPKKVFHGIQDDRLAPDFVVNITPYFEQRKQAILAFESQFFNPNYSKEEPQSYISSMDFLNFLEARSREMGHLIGATFGEGFVSSAHLEADTPLDFV